MKKNLIILITILVIYLIYYVNNTNGINYVSISDSLNNYDNDIYEYLPSNSSFNNYFNSSSIIGLFKDIKNNRTIMVNGEIYYLKKVLRESDVLVINVGMSELAKFFNKYDMDYNYHLLEEMIANIKKMVIEVKKYAYGKIIFIGYYNPVNYYDANIDRLFYDVNIKLERLMIDNNIIYLDLYEKVKGNNYKDRNGSSLNLSGNKMIANIIKYYLK